MRCPNKHTPGSRARVGRGAFHKKDSLEREEVRSKEEKRRIDKRNDGMRAADPTKAKQVDLRKDISMLCIVRLKEKEGVVLSRIPPLVHSEILGWRM